MEQFATTTSEGDCDDPPAFIELAAEVVSGSSHLRGLLRQGGERGVHRGAERRDLGQHGNRHRRDPGHTLTGEIQHNEGLGTLCRRTAGGR